MSFESIILIREFIEKLDFDTVLRLVQGCQLFYRILTSRIKFVYSPSSTIKLLRIRTFTQIEYVADNINLVCHPDLKCPRLRVGRIVIKPFTLPMLNHLLSWLSFPLDYAYQITVYFKNTTFTVDLVNDRCVVNNDVINQIDKSDGVFGNYMRDVTDIIQVLRRILISREALRLVIREENREFFFKSGLFNHNQLLVT